MVEEKVFNCRYNLEYSQSLLGESKTGRERGRLSSASRLNFLERREGKNERVIKEVWERRGAMCIKRTKRRAKRALD